MPEPFQIISDRFPWLKPKGFVSPANSNPDHNLDSNQTGSLVLALDCMPLESPNYINEVTKSSVEDGATINDHVTQKPLVLNVEGIISNTPLPDSVAFITTNNKLFPNPATRAFQILEAMSRARQPFDFVGGFRVYKNMIITSFKPTRTAKTGQAMNFSMTLEQIRTVSTQLVQVAKIMPAQQKTAAPANQLGTQVTSPAAAKGVEPTAQTTGDMTALKLAPANIPISFVGGLP